MRKFILIEIELCEYCGGKVSDGQVLGCPMCDFTGGKRKEIDLREALAEIGGNSDLLAPKIDEYREPEITG